METAPEHRSPDHGWWQASDGQMYPPDDHPDPAHRFRWALRQAPPGPGWWLAGDGRYYPPEEHEDPSYRARFDAASDRPDLDGPPETWPSIGAGELATAGPPPNVVATLFATIGSLAGVSATFLSWVDFTGDVVGSTRGWDLDPDGQLVLVACAVAAAVAGAMWCGARHLAVKLVLFASGLLCAVVAISKIGDIAALDGETLAVSVETGVGLWLLGPAGIALMLAAVVDRGPWRPSRPPDPGAQL